MTILSYLIPRTVLRTSSPYNRDIRVIEEWGELKLLVNGSRESGPYIRTLWEAAFKAFDLEAVQRISSILILGVGGGTVIKLLADRYPLARITAVDIDPVIVEIAKRYFRLDAIANLCFVLGDAQTVVKAHMKSRNKYDLIIVDLFIGSDIPDFVASRAFYQSLNVLLRSDGVILLNCLLELSYKEKSDRLHLLFQDMFKDIRDYRCFNNSNRFFFVK